MTPRHAVLTLFRLPGCPVALSRETISRMTSIAYPTLDPILDQLVTDGLLSKTRIFGGYLPTPLFEFQDTRREAQLAARARKKAEREASWAAQDQRREQEKATKKLLRAQEKAARAQEKATKELCRQAQREANAAASRDRKNRLRRKPTPDPAPAPRHTSPAAPPTPPPTLEPDVWSTLRARAAARPQMPTEPSTIAPLTPEQMMRRR